MGHDTMKKLAKLNLLICLLVFMCSAAYDSELASYLKVLQESEHLKSYLYTEGAPEGSIHEDVDGYLWSLKGQSLYKFNGSNWLSMDRYLQGQDIRKEKKLLATTDKQIVVAVEDGFYRWIGHGFKKYLLPDQEIIPGVAMNQEFEVDREKVLYFGTKGYSVLDTNGLHYYPHSSLPYRQYGKLVKGGTPQSRLFQISKLYRIVDSRNRVWSLRTPLALTHASDWDGSNTAALYLRYYHRGQQDSLVLLSPEALSRHKAMLHQLMIQAIGDDAIIAIPGSSSFCHLDMAKGKISEIPLYENAVLRSINCSEDRSKLYVAFTTKTALYLHQYAKDKYAFSLKSESSLVLDRDFTQYKGIIVKCGDDILNIKLERNWTNNSDDYYFGVAFAFNSMRIANLNFFADRSNARNATVIHSGCVLAVIRQDPGAPAMKVTINNLQLSSSVSYHIPQHTSTEPGIAYSNKNFVLFKGTGRLWHLDTQKLISVDLNNSLLPGLHGSAYLKVEQVNPKVISASIHNPLASKLYKEDSSGTYSLIATLPGDYSTIGYTSDIWYYQKKNQSGWGVYALQIKTGKAIQLCATKYSNNARVSGTGLFIASNDSLVVYSGTQRLLSSRQGVFSDSLQSWFGGNKALLSEFYESANLIYNEGVLWHSRNGYPKSRLDGVKRVTVPSFSYEVQEKTLKIHPELLHIQSVSERIWALAQKEDDNALCLKSFGKSPLSLRLPDRLAYDPLTIEGCRMFPGSVSPILSFGDDIWYQYQTKWDKIEAPAYGQIGNLSSAFYHRYNIWIVGYKGVYCYSPISKMGFAYGESDGLPGSIMEAWSNNSRIIVQGWEYHLEESKIISINEVGSDVKLSIPWFEEGSTRYNINSYPRLKHQQNNIRIPVDILNESYPEKCSIKHLLHGYDKEPQTSSYTPYLEYRRLKPGKYSLDIAAYSPEGYFSEANSLVRFRISPPFWANVYAYIFYVLLIVGFIYALIRFRTRNLAMQKQALEDEVGKRTVELREKQLSMMQSLEYASLIQSSILPLESELQALLPEYFIVFKPRDVVSGDFYWLHQEQQHFYLALIDCTGHGVPGALIAVTVNSILNSLIKDRGISEPKDILTLAHQEIGRILHQQSSHNQQDGFEIALLRVEPAKGKICFAGAQRPLYVFSEGKMLKIAGDRNGIGGLKWHRELQFGSTSFSYRPHSRFYLFSDGIVDQPHPGYGRRLGSPRWMEYIKDHALLPMAQQENAVELILQQMLEYSEQRDDITVMGFELP